MCIAPDELTTQIGGGREARLVQKEKDAIHFESTWPFSRFHLLYHVQSNHFIYIPGALTSQYFWTGSNLCFQTLMQFITAAAVVQYSSSVIWHYRIFLWKKKDASERWYQHTVAMQRQGSLALSCLGWWYHRNHKGCLDIQTPWTIYFICLFINGT